MIGDGVSQVWWAVITALAVAGALALAAFSRKGFRWFLRQIKEGYLDWFAEAVDAHVQPQFEAIREDATERAAELKQEAIEAAALVAEQARLDTDMFRKDLERHTKEEGRLVRDVVREELGPIREDLFDMRKVVVGHLKSDEENFAAGRDALREGQDLLVKELQVIRSSLPSTS